MLKLRNVSKYYHSNDTVAMGLRKINVDFELGEFVAVTGESGSGKSTLLNVISGLDTYEDGELYVNDEETSYFSVAEWENYRRQYIGFVFQEYNIIDSYSVYENVMIALTIQGYDKDKREDRAKELIDRVGLTSHVHHKASKLSGGQKQRAVIARALAKDCPIIVADEPTGNLDSKSSETIIKLLKEISKDKLVIVVTHNYDEVAEYATRKIRLFDGEIVEDKQVKSYDKVTEPSEVMSYAMTVLNSLGIATKNLLRTPKRTLFTLTIGIFIALIFMFSFGSFVQSTNQSNNFYGGGYFDNITESRIIVTKFDASPFTQSEIDDLKTINRVRTVVNHDVILDTVILSLFESEEYDWINSKRYYINPAAVLTTSDLKQGTLPNDKLEVVINETDEYNVGDTIDLSYSYAYEVYDPDTDTVTRQMPPTTTYTIVGMTKYGARSWNENLYFHNDFLTDQETVAKSYFGSNYGANYVQLEVEASDTVNDRKINLSFHGKVVMDDTLSDNEIIVPVDIGQELAYGLQMDPEVTPDWTDDVTFQLLSKTNFYDDEMSITLLVENDEDEEIMEQRTYVSEAIYNALIPDEYYQISVMVEDSYDATIVMTQLELQGYNTIYPSDVTDMYGQIIQLIQTIYFGFLMGFLMVIIYFISYIVLRNVQNAKKKDYLVFRSIGASKKALNRVTIFELIMTMILAYVLTVGFFILNQYINTFIPNYLRYFKWTTYLAIFTILVLLAVLLGNRFNKKIFSRSVITALKQE